MPAEVRALGPSTPTADLHHGLLRARLQRAFAASLCYLMPFTSGWRPGSGCGRCWRCRLFWLAIVTACDRGLGALRQKRLVAGVSERPFAPVLPMADPPSCSAESLQNQQCIAIQQCRERSPCCRVSACGTELFAPAPFSIGSPGSVGRGTGGQGPPTPTADVGADNAGEPG